MDLAALQADARTHTHPVAIRLHGTCSPAAHTSYTSMQSLVIEYRPEPKCPPPPTKSGKSKGKNVSCTHDAPKRLHLFQCGSLPWVLKVTSHILAIAVYLFQKDGGVAHFCLCLFGIHPVHTCKEAIQLRHHKCLLGVLCHLLGSVHDGSSTHQRENCYSRGQWNSEKITRDGRCGPRSPVDCIPDFQYKWIFGLSLAKTVLAFRLSVLRCVIV